MKSFGGTADASALVRNSDVLHGLRVHLEKIVPATVSRTSDYGDDYWADRSYGALDPEGHLWWFMQRTRTGKKG